LRFTILREEKVMKRRIHWSICLIAILVSAIIAYEGVLTYGATLDENERATTNDKAGLDRYKILTPEEVEKMFPNLPKAAELIKQPHGGIDLRFYRGPPIQNMTIFNAMNFWHGGIIENVTNIWLRYNETIWVQVPYSYLNSSKSSRDLASDQPSASQQPRTWSIGIYADPAEITAEPVEGAVSFGSWGDWSESDPWLYIGADVLSVRDDIFLMQLVMAALQSSDNKYVVINVWNLVTYELVYYKEKPVNVPTGLPLHSIKIRYKLYGQDRWDFAFDDASYEGWYWWDGYSEIMKGNQPNVVFETNDYIEWGGLTSYHSVIGGGYSNGWPQPALGYFIRGRQVWWPYNPEEHLPTAYAYHGGYGPPYVIFGVGIDPPLPDFGEMGHDFWRGIQPDREQLYLGWLYPQPPYGTMMWHNG